MTNQPTSIELELEQRRSTVHAEIGRLLLLYQHLELMLKALLPHVHASEQAALEQADKDMDNLLDSSKTMELIVNKLKQSLEFSDPEGFSVYLRRITTNRNELVHKFTLSDFGALDDQAKCSNALEYLKAQYEFALPLRGVLLSFLTTLVATPDTRQ